MSLEKAIAENTEAVKNLTALLSRQLLELQPAEPAPAVPTTKVTKATKPKEPAPTVTDVEDDLPEHLKNPANAKAPAAPTETPVKNITELELATSISKLVQLGHHAKVEAQKILSTYGAARGRDITDQAKRNDAFEKFESKRRELDSAEEDLS